MKKIGFHPLFALVCVIVIILGDVLVLFNYLLAVILHELSHSFVANKLGYSLNKFYLMPYGAGLSFNQNFTDEKDEILIASAGPLFSFALALFFTAFWWIAPQTYVYTQHFVWANLITGIINLCPAYPLDGGRILTAFLTLKTHNRKQALWVSFVFNYLFSLLLFTLFVLSGLTNISFLCFAIFLLLGTMESKFSGNYSIKNFPFFENSLTENKRISINQFAVPASTSLYKLAPYLKKNKLNLIVVIFDNNKIKILSENLIISFFKKYPSNTKLNEIL